MKLVEPLEDILYEIGISLTSVRDRPKRPLYNNPLIVFLLTVLFLIGRTLSVITPEDDTQTLNFIGDVGHFFGLKLHFNMIFIIASIILYGNGIQSKFIGKTEELSEEEIRKLKSQYVKICIFIKRNNTYLITMLSAIVILIPFILFTSPYKILIFGVPHSIHFTIIAYYFCNSIGFQFIQFYIICKYFKQRVKQLRYFIVFH